MAVSNVILYQTEITPERNCKVDDMNAYLRTCSQKVIEDFQYFKAELDTTVKVNMPQANTPNFPYNYFTIANEGENFVYYYFILGTKWLSANTIQLKLSLDTINTFWSKLQWTAKTNITRQHKDRYAQESKKVSGNDILVRRKVDDFEEGVTPVKFLKRQDKIENTASSGLDHYLIYYTEASAGTQEILRCFYCTNKELKVQAVTTSGIKPSDYPKSYIIIFSRDNEDFTYTALDGKKYEIGKNKTYKGVYIVTSAGGDKVLANIRGITDDGGLNNNTVFDENVESTILSNTPIIAYRYERGRTTFKESDSYSQTLDNYQKYEKLGEKIEAYQTQGFIKSIYAINRTDTKIVKIIKMPYAPFDMVILNDISGDSILKTPSSWNYNAEKHLLELADLNQEFLSTVSYDVLDELADVIFAPTIGTETNSETHESKLFNSNFYTVKYYYDNFDKEVLLERTKPLLQANGDEPQVDIKFKQSNNISSNSIFDFSVKGVAEYKEPQLYGQYMSVNRAQELALYNSAYLDYIRNGYNYDKKAQSLSIGQNIVSFTLSTAAGVVSLFTGNPVGAAAAISFGASALSTLTSTIFSTISSENAIQQKLETTAKSAASVSNTTDLNLLSYYNGNRLITTRSQCSDQVRAAIYDLFRLTGYACNEYEIPNFDTRIYYNFVQCKPDFVEKQWTFGQDFLNDIKQKFEIGVTIYHKYNNSYDFLQEKENYEVWLPTTS